MTNPFHFFHQVRERISRWRCLWLLLALCAIGNTFASDIVEGFDYRTLKAPLSTSAGTKIEVIEFFWYNCPHCNAMEPLIEPWAKRNSSRILFKRVPYARNEEWVPQQQLYFALQAMGEVEAWHSRIFQAIHEQKIPLKSVAQMADYVQRQGLDRQRFLAAFKSPAVIQQTLHAAELAEQAVVESVPSIVVDGRYITYANLTGGSNAEVLQIADSLVNKALLERKKKAREQPVH
ncbi:MAG: thiol:disulfide interchange protein DsbA/DsbL [Thiobacillus sp.]|nr:thiol:disulfide interchange protein DsbA/DsbL [Thiobacillus sp.]